MREDSTSLTGTAALGGKQHVNLGRCRGAYLGPRRQSGAGSGKELGHGIAFILPARCFHPIHICGAPEPPDSEKYAIALNQVPDGPRIVHFRRLIRDIPCLPSGHRRLCLEPSPAAALHSCQMAQLTLQHTPYWYAILMDRYRIGTGREGLHRGCSAGPGRQPVKRPTFGGV